MHFFILEFIICFLQTILSGPNKHSKVIVRTFLKNVGVIFQIVQWILLSSEFLWIWLFYLLEEVSMSNNLWNSWDTIEILIAFLFLGLNEGLYLNLSATKDCPSFLKCHINWSFLQYSCNCIFYILGPVCFLQTFRQQWFFRSKGISSWEIYYIFTNKFTF